MKKYLGLLVWTLLAGSIVSKSEGAIIINEVYSGGGSTNPAASFTRDFVELANTGLTNVDVSGWRVMYASSSGNFTNTVIQFDVGSFIAAGETVTLVTGNASTGGATLTAAEANYIGPTTTASLAAGTGSLAIFDNTDSQIDVVGWGSLGTTTGNLVTGGPVFPKVEGTSATAGSVSLSMNRTAFVDTGNNSADFTTAAPTPTLGANSVIIAVPEPTSMTMLVAAGIGGFVARRRLKKANANSVAV